MKTIILMVGENSFKFGLTTNNNIRFWYNNDKEALELEKLEKLEELDELEYVEFNPFEFDPFEEDEAEDNDPYGVRKEFLDEGDSEKIANIRTYLWYNGPYLDYCLANDDIDAPRVYKSKIDFSKIRIMDQIVLHLLGLLPIPPPNSNLKFRITNSTIFRDNSQNNRRNLPITDTDCENFRASALYSNLVI